MPSLQALLDSPSHEVVGVITRPDTVAGRGRKVEIPARPYLPLTTDGDLQPEAREEVLDTILRHLKRAAGV